ncbi:MAG: 50S ribosomal protein L10 [Balneolales bacterium]
MATTLEQKKAIVEELVETITNSDALYLADYKGMSVADTNNLRADLREKDINYKVYNNKLVRRALQQIGGYEAIDEYLINQTAYAFVKGDPAVPAKVFKKHFKENKKPEFKAAFIEGVLYKSDQLEALSSMKSKEEMIGEIVGLLMSPINNIVGGLQAQGSNIVGAVKTISEKEEE